MNSKKAKYLKKLLYKKDNPNERSYTQLKNGQVVADIQRSVYQTFKKECKNMSKKEIEEHLMKRG